jgi:hypothetical protein
MAPPDGWYYIQTPEGNNVVCPEKIGDKLFIAAAQPQESYQKVN